MTDPQTPQLLAIEHATLRKNGQVILNDLTLTIPEGQHTAILGPNGSGKSSLIKLITHQHYALARVDGEPTVSILGRHRWNLSELRSMMGIVSADMHLFLTVDSDLTGAEVVVSGFFASKGIARHHRVTQAMHAMAGQALADVDGANLAEKLMERMSTGEARRVLIARSLVNNPRALVLDEPTTGLDLVAAGRFLETLRAVARGGRTVMLVTHHVDEVLPEIERVVLLKEGRVYRDGPKSEVLTTANLSAMFEADVTVTERGGWYGASVR